MNVVGEDVGFEIGRRARRRRSCVYRSRECVHLLKRGLLSRLVLWRDYVLLMSGMDLVPVNVNLESEEVVVVVVSRHRFAVVVRTSKSW
jgi:hypothetical protein